jgi:apolipoprotein N-acyltransferase
MRFECEITYNSGYACARPVIRQVIRHMMQHMIRRTFLVFLACSAALLAQANPDWHREFPAFKIAGNLYYVGTADLAVYT